MIVDNASTDGSRDYLHRLETAARQGLLSRGEHWGEALNSRHPVDPSASSFI